ncbi:MAG: nucleotide exchange factor GrpE [Holosporales bacterium]|jgi:molecular chaperone GrpE|nr:nucleotide exchange factor GrpE [Holosporales bacterium]
METEQGAKNAAPYKEAESPEGAPEESPQEPEKTELEQCAEEKAQLKDQLLRTLAELENLRKRVEREREETLKYSVTKFSKDFLTVLDAFQKALSASEATSVETLLEGLRMAEKEFLSTLTRHGVQAVAAQKGDAFDPAYHQAMFEVETADTPAGTIVEVLQTGYCLHDRLLRPALVGVAKKTSQPAGPSEQ